MSRVDDRWQRVKDIFGAALELPASAREAYLRDACGGDDALRSEVERLLEGQSAAGEFLSRSPGLAEPERTPALAPGRSLGNYAIVAPIGAGGMGEVYRARDTHLGREVAIKVLPDVFGKDADRLSRFAREARILASLNHPNIAAVHGFEESDGTRFLIMELVPGDTLAERLRDGPLPIKDALALAQQIAEALEEAHGKGIIHRDLKPANVKVTAGGKVKVLDFGLAKALAPEAASGDPSQSPTLTRTAAAIVGTAAYMSPEQARGKPVDKRTDVWAFGCVLYEMLTGRALFAGETTSDVIANILKHDPDWTRLPAETPARVRDVLRRCLQKDPHRRLHDVADARIELEESPADASAPPTGASRRREGLAWALAAIAIVGAAALWRSREPRDVTQRAPISFLVNPPEHSHFSPTADSSFPQFAISADGSRLVFVAAGPDRKPMLWVRRLDSITPVPLSGTEGASFPFWSPDGRQIGFFARAKLKKVELAGGSPQTLADASDNARGGTWGSSGVIVYSPFVRSGLFQINAEGGSPAAVSELEPSAGDDSHRWPHFLPDGRHFLFVRRGLPPKQGIYVGSLDSKAITQLNEEITSAAFAPPSHVLFARRGALMAARLDLRRLVLEGSSFPVIERIDYSPSILYTGASVSPTGVLVYASGGVSTSRLQWFDRNGQRLETVGEPGYYLHPQLSPDGTQIVTARLDAQTSNYDLWLFDAARRSGLRFTIHPRNERFPIWSPDGRRIVFTTQAKRLVADLAWKPADEAEAEESILTEAALGEGFSRMAHDWSRDGRWIAYHGTGRAQADRDTGYDVYLYDTVTRKEVPQLTQRFNELQARFSSDGRLLAYASDESGRFEIYVQPLPATGSKWQISAGGGLQPRWRRDDKELFYIAADGMLMAVPLEGKTAFKAGIARPLFHTDVPSQEVQYANDYSVAADGQRFLINTLVSRGVSPLTVVTNWSAAQKRQ